MIARRNKNHFIKNNEDLNQLKKENPEYYERNVIPPAIIWAEELVKKIDIPKIPKFFEVFKKNIGIDKHTRRYLKEIISHLPEKVTNIVKKTVINKANHSEINIILTRLFLEYEKELCDLIEEDIAEIIKELCDNARKILNGVDNTIQLQTVCSTQQNIQQMQISEDNQNNVYISENILEPDNDQYSFLRFDIDINYTSEDDYFEIPSFFDEGIYKKNSYDFNL